MSAAGGGEGTYTRGTHLVLTSYTQKKEEKRNKKLTATRSSHTSWLHIFYFGPRPLGSLSFTTFCA